MLNKVLIGTVVNVVLNVIQAFFPQIPIPEGLSESIIVIVVFLAQYFTKETALSVAKLVLK